MERFFKYSWQHQRPIRLILMAEDGQIRQQTAQVIAYDETSVQLLITRGRKNVTVKREDILSADYRAGDEGQA